MISNTQFAGNYETKKLIEKWFQARPIVPLQEIGSIDSQAVGCDLVAGHTRCELPAEVLRVPSQEIGYIDNQTVGCVLPVGVPHPHCIMVEGEEKTGKKLLARLIAQSALCQNNTMCGQCPSCKKIIAGAHPDIEIYGSNDKPSDYAIDIVRNIRSGAYVLPNEAKYRIIILQNAHNMSEYAQNALLKIIEEPPEHLLFILTVRSDKRMLPTVLSRCTRITTSPVSKQDAMQWLTVHYPNVSHEVLSMAAERSGGILGKAVELIESKPSAAEDIAQRMLEALIFADELSLLRICGQCEKDRQLFNDMLSALAVLLCDALSISAKSDITVGINNSICQKAAQALSKKVLIGLIADIKQLREYNNGFMNMNLLLSICSSNFICTVRK